MHDGHEGWIKTGEASRVTWVAVCVRGSQFLVRSVLHSPPLTHRAA